MFKKYLFFLFLSIITISIKAQPIVDTIYVNSIDDIAVQFPSEVISRNWTPSDAISKYNLISLPTRSGFTIRAAQKGVQPARLLVGIGKKNYNFFISFKEKLNYSIDYAYTYEKLDRLIKRQELKEKPNNATSTENNNNKKPADDYYQILESGDKKFNQRLYAEAKIDFENAHKKRPDQPYPTQRLEDIKEKLDEKEKKDQKLKGDFQLKYKNYMADADRKLKQNQLEDARTSYEQALLINKNDPEASKQITIINEKESKLKQTEDIKSNYTAAIKVADKAFGDMDYAAAEKSYKKAMDFNVSKDPWPQDQVNKIHKVLADITKKTADDKKALEDKALAEKKEKENKKTEDEYNDILKTADKYFKNNKLDKAKTEYNNALDLKKDGSWPKEQLAKIDVIFKEKNLKEKSEKEKEAIRIEKDKRILEDKAREEKYQAAIKNADELFKLHSYTSAKAAYQAAMAISKKPEAEEQVKKIDKIIADEIAAAKAERIRLEQEKVITEKYDKVKIQADAQFAKNNYPLAKKLYMDAAAIKPVEAYPKQKLIEIQAALDAKTAIEKAERERKVAEAELKRKYDLAISKAKSFYLKDDLVNAQTAYQEANGYKPKETEPQNQLRIITDKLSFIARQNDTIERYESKIEVGDSLLNAQKYELAKTAFNEAHEIKPSERFPLSQIKYIDSQIKEERNNKEENDKREAMRKELEKENQVSELSDKAWKSFRARNWEPAIEQYTELLRIDPDNNSAGRCIQIAKYQLGLAKNAPKNIGNEPGKPGVNNTSKVLDTTVYAVPGQVSPYTRQVASIPYDSSELYEKYPGIDFSKVPPEQPLSDSFVDSKNNANIFYKVLNQKPTLNISDKSNKVRLICQNLHFEDKDTSVYIKLLIQNGSEKDFLTGAMMFTWIKRTGSKIRLYPTYLYPATLPIVKPGNEAVVIYVCKSYDIGENEKLEFDLSDRKNKIKFELTIKGSLFYEESTR